MEDFPFFQNHMQLTLFSCLVLAEDLGIKANLPSPCGVPVARGDSNNTEMDQEANIVFSEVHHYMSPQISVVNLLIRAYIFNLVFYSSIL